MWQAHLWPMTNAGAKREERNLTRRCRPLASAVAVASVLLCMGGVTHGSEELENQTISSDFIYNEPSIQSRVFGGGDADSGDWPSMAGIVISDDFPLEDRFFCGGSVIADRWILTAAHCMFDSFGEVMEPFAIRALVGITDLQDDSAEELVVSNIYVHPQYNVGGGTLRNDIALVELANAVNVPVSTLYAGDPESLNDTLAFIAGWGATGINPQNGSEVYPNLLQDASVPLVPLARCNSDESYRGGISDTQVCAGFREGGIDSCVGDSGGPLYYIENGEQVQVGITSFGNGCGEPNFYGVYTNISSFRTWIGDFIEIKDSTTVNGFTAAGPTESGTDIGSAVTTAVSSAVDTGIGETISLAENALEVGAAVEDIVSASKSSTGGSMNIFFIALLLGCVKANKQIRDQFKYVS